MGRTGRDRVIGRRHGRRLRRRRGAVASGVNRMPSEVRPDSNAYCFERLSANGFGQPDGRSIVIVALTSATDLRVERQDGATCGNGPWSFTAKATTFVR